MFDSLPIDDYKANLEAILDNKPILYGNMKGQLLNKQKFMNDLNDFDLILRKHVPLKYSKYFYSPDDKPPFDNDTESIELTRSIPVPSYNLSPLKKQQPPQSSSALKDSQKLMNDLFSKDRKQYHKKGSSVRFNNDSDDPSLLLNEPSYIPLKNSPISSQINSAKFTIEELKSLKLENKELLRMIHSLQSKLSTYEQSNNDLKVENQNLNKQQQEQQERLTTFTPKYLDELIDLQSDHERLKRLTKEIQFKLKVKVDECNRLKVELSHLKSANLTTIDKDNSKEQHLDLQDELESIDSQLKSLNKKKLRILETQKQKQKEQNQITKSKNPVDESGVTNIQNYFNISENSAKKLLHDLIDPVKLQDLLTRLRENGTDIASAASIPAAGKQYYSDYAKANTPQRTVNVSPKEQSITKITPSISSTPGFIRKRCEVCNTPNCTASHSSTESQDDGLTSLIAKIGNSQNHDLETIRLLDILSKNNGGKSKQKTAVWS